MSAPLLAQGFLAESPPLRASRTPWIEHTVHLMRKRHSHGCYVGYYVGFRYVIGAITAAAPGKGNGSWFKRSSSSDSQPVRPPRDRHQLKWGCGCSEAFGWFPRETKGWKCQTVRRRVGRERPIWMRRELKGSPWGRKWLCHHWGRRCCLTPMRTHRQVHRWSSRRPVASRVPENFEGGALTEPKNESTHLYQPAHTHTNNHRNRTLWCDLSPFADAENRCIRTAILQ